MTTNRAEHQIVRKALLQGAIAGAAGTAVMTLGEKLEQALTGRPDSSVPAHTLERLLGLRERPDSERIARNLIMHFGTGILAGAIRGLMSRGGARGFKGFMTFLGVRMAMDQLLETSTAVGAPHDELPLDERWIDKGHKAVYALVTGVIADALIEAVRREEHPEIWDHIEEQSPFMASKVRKKRPDLAARPMLDS